MKNDRVEGREKGQKEQRLDFVIKLARGTSWVVLLGNILPAATLVSQ